MRSSSLAGLLRPLPCFFMMLAILGLCSSPASAQTFYGSIVGTVTDVTGAVVTDATVVITDIGTAEKHTAQTNG